MIRASGTTADGEEIVFLGLSKEDVETLQNNESLSFEFESELGYSATMIVFGGQTDDDGLRARLAEHFELPS